MNSIHKLPILVLLAFTLSACTAKPSVAPTPDLQDYTTTRTYYIGTSGYTPANFPDSSLNEITTYWEEIDQSGEIYGVHLDWKDTRFIDTAKTNTDQNISVVLGYQEPSEWISKETDFIAKASQILKDGRVKYLAIGNEVNILEEKYPNDFPKFIESYKRIYLTLKETYPNVKVYTTFQYEHLRGDGFLMGNKEKRDSNFELLNKFDNHIDLIGITTYPYFDFASPAEIPDTYFSDIKKYSDEPIAVTETGWMARETYGGKLSYINEIKLTGSEEEQVEYLHRLVELTNSADFEFISWLGLNDFVTWKNGDVPTKYETFDSISLKYNDGSPKKAWAEWKELASK